MTRHNILSLGSAILPLSLVPKLRENFNLQNEQPKQRCGIAHQ